MTQIAYAIYIYAGLVALILVGFWFVSVAETRKSLTSLTHLLEVTREHEISVRENASRSQLSDAAASLGSEQLSINKDSHYLNHDIARDFILTTLGFMKQIAEIDRASAREQAQEKSGAPEREPEKES